MNTFLDHCQEVFIEFLMGSCTGSREAAACGSDGGRGGVSSLEWNRIDSFSYTFLVVIAYNSNRYYPESEHHLLTLFLVLITSQ